MRGEWQRCAHAIYLTTDFRCEVHRERETLEFGVCDNNSKCREDFGNLMLRRESNCKVCTMQGYHFTRGSYSVQDDLIGCGSGIPPSPIYKDFDILLFTFDTWVLSAVHACLLLRYDGFLIGLFLTLHVILPYEVIFLTLTLIPYEVLVTVDNQFFYRYI